jgi:hypothetical protein
VSEKTFLASINVYQLLVLHIIFSTKAKLKLGKEVFVRCTAEVMINTIVAFALAGLAVQTMCLFTVL